MNPNSRLKQVTERVRGCLIGGAIGDALGAPVEFDSLDSIRARSGEAGVTDYLPAYGLDGGAITDDTQMTLFTAEGFIRARNRMSDRGICNVDSVVHRAYIRWLITQSYETEYVDADFSEDPPSGWLVTQEILHSRRAPGNTCIAALRSRRERSIERTINDSKGCGAVMRAAPAGIIGTTPGEAFDFGILSGAITHGNPSGYLPAGVLASIVFQVVRGATLEEAIEEARSLLCQHDGHEETLDFIDAAAALAANGLPSPEAIETLGGGWMGHDALAISLCCALAADDYEEGVLCAVNHSGDSDSTGSITGNLLGALLGEGAIPKRWIERLEALEVISTVSDDLASAALGPGYISLDRYPTW
ncbi:MAG: ADP-ribosylglycohydrolase [Acidobacteria bacterium]|nr:MAG: ADP-ribosylglycohydrolase [Acidobacteriota bacterium]